jgi:hypothetical protein
VLVLRSRLTGARAAPAQWTEGVAVTETTGAPFDWRPDVRLPRQPDDGFDSAWHRAINDYAAPYEAQHAGRRRASWDPPVPAERDGKRFMYEAKRLAHEVPRLAYLFGRERRRELPTLHRQCSHAHAVPVADNHLRCCLGVECRQCPHLAAIDGVRTRRTLDRVAGEDGKRVAVWVVEPIPDEQRDVLKAWTCATHIAMRGGDSAGEGYILTTDDRMFWDNMYRSLAGEG